VCGVWFFGDRISVESPPSFRLAFFHVRVPRPRTPIRDSVSLLVPRGGVGSHPYSRTSKTPSQLLVFVAPGKLPPPCSFRPVCKVPLSPMSSSFKSPFLPGLTVVYRRSENSPPLLTSPLRLTVSVVSFRAFSFWLFLRRTLFCTRSPFISASALFPPAYSLRAPSVPRPFLRARR